MESEEQQSDVGYPESQPEEVVPDDDAPTGKDGSASEDGGRPEQDAARAPDNDDGTATGNP